MDMKEFKEQYEVPIKPRVYTIVEEHMKQGKEQKEKVLELTEEQKEKNRIVDLINRAYDAEKLTEEEKKEFLSIDENAIPNTMLKKLYQLARVHVEGGTIDFNKLTEPGPEIDVTPKELRERMKRQLELIEKQSKEGTGNGREI